MLLGCIPVKTLLPYWPSMTLSMSLQDAQALTGTVPNLKTMCHRIGGIHE